LKACVLPFSPALVGSDVLGTFDVVVLPEAFAAHETLPPSVELKAVSVSPLDHEQEFELISRCVDMIGANLVTERNDAVWPVLSRGLYLSAIKAELRVFMRVAIMAEELRKSGVESISIFYRYCVFDSLFRSAQMEVDWVPCDISPKLVPSLFKRILKKPKRLIVGGTRRTYGYLTVALRRAVRALISAARKFWS